MNVFTWSNILLFIVTCILILMYSCILKNWWYFSSRNTKFIRGWPFVGTLHEFFFGNKSFADSVASFYFRFANEPFFGIYELTYPVFVVRNPELVKKITTQDFEHFLNHQSNFDENLDSILARSLFFSRDQKWKDMRSVLSASFTGNKMRMMFDLICDCTNKFILTLVKGHSKSSNSIEFELKDLFSRYTTNLIATSAFGLEVDAVTDNENEFYLAGKKVTNFDGIQGIKLLLLDVMPKLIKFCRIPFLDESLCNYFRNVVLSTMAYREKNNVFRPDMIHLLMEARKGTLQDADGNATKKYDWKDDDIVAQCAIFFFAGFETTSTLISFMTHELACNQDVQQKLYDEIIAIEKELNGGPVTYEIIKGFKFMEMVVLESLRLWPPVSQSDRQVAKPYRLEANGNVVQLTTYDAIWIPIYAIHRDPEYWSHPNRFDPERFNEENRKTIQACTYLPFGNGMRTCIASRFALMVAKTFFYHLLREFKIDKSDKTPNPVILKPNSINMHAENGLWARFMPRQ
ncbi:cytochrome P450 9e2-like [Contarinia nasturtii]|uniref:cytochrome P450 9e2-like n=1 Tax=Contarinia nasturtii TaxID=265458 RepID=UPI0012D38636|nr:cytochrome P450 9e2-like [Contarinia nasturtii]